MDYNNMSKGSKAAMSFVTVVLAVSAVMLGAYWYTDRDSNSHLSDAQEQIQEFPRTMYVGVTVCRIRAGAGEEFDVVGLLGEGEKLITLQETEGKDNQSWYRIDKKSLPEGLDVSSVEECYIRSDLLLR